MYILGILLLILVLLKLFNILVFTWLELLLGAILIFFILMLFGLVI